MQVDSFLEIVKREGARPRVYEGAMMALEAVDLLVSINALGNHVLALARRGKLSPDERDSLIAKLINFYSEPLSNSDGIKLISRELRRYD